MYCARGGGRGRGEVAVCCWCCGGEEGENFMTLYSGDSKCLSFFLIPNDARARNFLVILMCSLFLLHVAVTPVIFGS